MPPTPVWAKPSTVALVIVAYLALHFAVRMAAWPTLGLDDAEQALFAQDFAWTYRYRAPPLFTWLLIALGRVIGVDIVSISLIRYALLGVTFAFIYLTARRLLDDPRVSALSVYGTGAAVYVFAWYTHHDLTHTTMLSAMLAVAWYVFVRLVASPTLGWYFALGGIFGLGLLAKWNFVMFAAALPLACLLVAPYRPLVLTWKLLPAALLAAMIVLPTFAAALQIGPPPGEDLRAVLGASSAPWLQTLAKGTWELFAALVLYPQPLFLLLLLLFGGPLQRGLHALPTPSPAAPRLPDLRLIGTVMAVSIALHWLLVPTLGASEFSNRLMQPPLQILPVALFMLIERGQPSERSMSRFALSLLVLALATLPARVMFNRIAADHCGTCRAMVPFADLADEIAASGFSGQGTILAEDFHVGGNMRVAFPDARVIDPAFPPAVWPPPRGSGQCLLVWQKRAGGQAERRAGDRLQTYLAAQLGAPMDASYRDGVVSAGILGSGTRSYSLNFRLYDGPVGDCR